MNGGNDYEKMEYFKNIIWLALINIVLKLGDNIVYRLVLLTSFTHSTNYTLRVDAFNGTYYIEGTTAQEDNPSTDIDFATLLGGE